MEFCPECKSTNIITRIYLPISKSGHLPRPMVDYCYECKFKSQQSFKSINITNSRELIIENILKHGIQQTIH